MIQPDWRDDPLMVALAAMALEPALSGILLFDATVEQAMQAAQLLVVLRRKRSGEAPPLAVLSSSAGEEEIWGAPRISAGPEGGVARRRGILSPRGRDEGIVVIPDLGRLGVSGTRAVVVHSGADVGILERDGESATWRPSLYWVAALARAEVGEVPPHLLDRFPLRVTLPPAPSADRSAEVLCWAMAEGPGEAASAAFPPVSPELLARVGDAAVLPPGVPAEVLAGLLAYFPARETPGTRRPLALARLARAWAELHGEREVTAGHVAVAARFAGLMPLGAGPEKAPEEEPPPSPEPAPQTAESRLGSAGPFEPGAPENAPTPATLTGAPQEPADSDAQVFPAAVLAPPYPEDDTPPAREANSLQLPPVHSGGSAADTGVPIGTRRAHDMRDIALVSTVFEAAKYRKVRPPLPGGLRVSPADLRSYRRVPLPQQVLALVLDYTALGQSRWQDALLPHLKWAYVSRASVLLVQVGARSAPEPLRATQIPARNLLSPQIRAALEEGPGTATPLAHGLDLAARSLRRAFTQGRARVRGGLVVVVTDGRGNVPLESSFAGMLRGLVMRQGIDDAMETARQFTAIRNLARVVLHPAPQQYPHLPLDLAGAMGADIIAMELARPSVEDA